MTQIAQAFHDRHLSTYGHDNRAEPVEIVSARVAAIGAIAPLAIRDAPAQPGSDAVKSKRELWFRETGAAEAAVYDRKRMHAGQEVAGPIVIESLDSTILVPPLWRARMSEDGFVVLTRCSAAPQARCANAGPPLPRIYAPLTLRFNPGYED